MKFLQLKKKNFFTFSVSSDLFTKEFESYKFEGENYSLKVVSHAMGDHPASRNGSPQLGWSTSLLKNRECSPVIQTPSLLLMGCGGGDKAENVGEELHVERAEDRWKKNSNSRPWGLADSMDFRGGRSREVRELPSKNSSIVLSSIHFYFPAACRSRGGLKLRGSGAIAGQVFIERKSTIDVPALVWRLCHLDFVPNLSCAHLHKGSLLSLRVRVVSSSAWICWRKRSSGHPAGNQVVAGKPKISQHQWKDEQKSRDWFAGSRRNLLSCLCCGLSLAVPQVPVVGLIRLIWSPQTIK